MIDRDRTPFRDRESRLLAGRFGMILFLVSLAVLFGATIVGIVVIRIKLERDGLWPRDLPGVPRGLLLSTIVLLLSSVTIERACRTARVEPGAARRWLGVTFVAGVVFLALQALCWWRWFVLVGDAWGVSDGWRMALTGFYLLTGLHAAHVVGGLIAMGVTLRPGEAVGVHTLADRFRSAATYWHFLGAVWLVLYAFLILTT